MGEVRQGVSKLLNIFLASETEVESVINNFECDNQHPVLSKVNLSQDQTLK